MLDFSNNDNLQVKGLTAQIKSTPGFNNVNDGLVSKAWDLAKAKADQEGINQDDPTYWDTITQQTKQDLGMQLPNTPKIGKPLNLQKSNTIAQSAPNVANPSTGTGAVVESKRTVKEMQDSGAFTATVPENACAWKTGKTGPEINSEARRRLDLMRKSGFGADLS